MSPATGLRSSAFALGAAAVILGACASFGDEEPLPPPRDAAGEGIGPVDGGDPRLVAPPPACTPARVPADAGVEAVIRFGKVAAIGAADWVGVGYDRDGLCTTPSSTDVCAPNGGNGDGQQDGVDGVDNAWGHVIVPILRSVGASDGSGFLTSNAAGAGTLELRLGNKDLVVPVVLVKLLRQGGNATLSALVPLDAFTVTLKRYVGSVDPTLCSGSTIASMVAQVRQAADILQDGTQTPTRACDAISLGLMLTDVTDGAKPPVLDAGASAPPCP